MTINLNVFINSRLLREPEPKYHIPYGFKSRYDREQYLKRLRANRDPENQHPLELTFIEGNWVDD